MTVDRLTMSKSRRVDARLIVILVVVLVAIVAMFFVPRIAQDPSYHHFVDQRRIFGINNFWNVATNIPFIVAGTLGLYILQPRMPDGGLPELKSAYRIFFFGILLVGFGSAYYHLNPSTHTLLWDRLPMTVAFMAFLSAMVGEHISIRAGNRLLAPVLVIGLCSVVYWYVTEAKGVGDLRPYGLVQFLPMVLIPIILVLYSSRFTKGGYIWLILGAYAASKIAEQYDSAVFQILGFISGHSVKHLFASLGALLMVLALVKRRRVDAVSSHSK